MYVCDRVYRENASDQPHPGGKSSLPTKAAPWTTRDEEAATVGPRLAELRVYRRDNNG